MEKITKRWKGSKTFGNSKLFYSIMKPNYENFLSERAKRRNPSAIRQLLPLTKIEGMISLGGGMPNPSLFPIKGMSLVIEDSLGMQNLVEIDHKLLTKGSKSSFHKPIFFV